MSNRSILSRYDLSAFFARHADLAVGIGILAVLALLIVPVPPFALDLFICVSFAASLTMLTTTLYVSKAAELASFPSLLLITTLLRLALAIASTKMILLHAHAGQIIAAFGQLVVGGNVAVGLVVFVVLAAIQFIVVAKGADRVAEVAARFTLDGIPGRQMSIDADMRNGVVTAAQASRMRAALERETYFYGSLDGAMKFVKGDAVAGLVVALVNIVGGLAVGIAQRGMSFGDALHTYTILTVGDGLVSQIPSLIVSVAAGILVTRVAAGDDAHAHLGGDIYRQLATHPKAIGMAGVACLSLAAIPGFPHIQFVVAGALLLALALTLIRNAALATNSQRALMPEMTRDGGKYVPRILDDVELGTSATLRLRLGLKAFDALRPEALNRQLGQLRRRLMVELGLPFPGLALLRDARLTPERYIVDIEDVPYASGTLVAGHTLVSGEESRDCVRRRRGLPAARREIGLGAERDGGFDQGSGDPQGERRRSAVRPPWRSLRTLGGRFSRHPGDPFPARSTGDRISRAGRAGRAGREHGAACRACCGNCCSSGCRFAICARFSKRSCACRRVSARSTGWCGKRASSSGGRSCAATPTSRHGRSPRPCWTRHGRPASKRRSEAASTVSRSACCRRKN